ncbi:MULTISPECIES: 4-hydroxythreonine-4-phosphate dehydrogenase PdxA [unclassified Aureimonas]|uniref:4-hydroxythreonine-4-phosphate dehydrogenase PdxA n=1 Tax=unclassified Aureimonas TaxID=2615206 RepID=UPI0006F28859|nr:MULTISPECIES: 4-hydroxythreonine-4-phosphate dehydrogenase PdxA [unclassified Aureimonas]KQT52927.1 4-hydroxythreonine-4-phosphate dehydrogenase [Aureimonas sp. Leaf427]KQT80386.1 4-hydroxythreonine-4-phosphate dehydrogenase [Aureimonas sp. Leaf460]
MSGAARPGSPERISLVTLGEPSGVGPDIALDAYRRRGERGFAPFAVFADPAMLRARADRLGYDIPFAEIAAPDEAPAVFADRLPILPLVNRQDERPGRLDPSNALGTVEAIDRAAALVLDGRAGAVVTGPIDKKALYDAGFRHPGHTEYLADLCERRLGGRFMPVMLLAGPDLSCVPVTIHVPLRDVAELLTTELIVETGRIVADHYIRHFGIARPRLAVSGLNPHAGERGAIGSEDEAIIAPAVAALIEEGIEAFGPLPADTMFHAEARAGYDVALCMYHDQALIPAKALAFDETVNVTLGLPLIRTSPDHGTAATLAGTGRARPASFMAALTLAERMVRRASAQVS